MHEWGQEVTEDALWGGRVRLLQPRRGHRAGTDALLLASLPGPEEIGGLVIDAGAATGAVGLVVAARAPAAQVALVERDPHLVRLAEANARLNGVAARVRAVEADLLADAARLKGLGLGPETADWVLTNPPYLDPGQGRPSPDPGRAAAHRLPPAGLRAWIRSCARWLRPGGRLGLIHRAERLPDCLAALDRGFGDLRLRPVHPRAGAPAHRILLTAVKGSRAPLTLHAPLVLHRPDGAFTAEAATLHGALPGAGA